MIFMPPEKTLVTSILVVDETKFTISEISETLLLKHVVEHIQTSDLI